MDKKKELLIDWTRLVDNTEKMLLNDEGNKMVALLKAIDKNSDILETEEEIQHYLKKGEDTALDVGSLKELLIEQTTLAIEAYKEISENDKLSKEAQSDMKRLVALIKNHTILGNDLKEKDLNAKELYSLIIESQTLKLFNDELLKLAEESKRDDE